MVLSLTFIMSESEMWRLAVLCWSPFSIQYAVLHMRRGQVQPAHNVSNFKHSLWTPSFVCIPIVCALLTFSETVYGNGKGDLRGTASLCAADLLITKASLQWGQLFDTNDLVSKEKQMEEKLEWAELKWSFYNGSLRNSRSPFGKEKVIKRTPT